MKQKLSPGQALKKLQQMCSGQEKCSADILKMLTRWKIDEEDIQSILEKLTEDKYIDDNRYATSFTRDKIKFDHWGMRKIRYHLLQKGIDKQVCNTVLSDVDTDQYKRMIEKELLKKRNTLTGSSYQIWAKLANYGNSRGYEMEYMQEYLDSIKHMT
jgi:regulatory protein